MLVHNFLSNSLEISHYTIDFRKTLKNKSFYELQEILISYASTNVFFKNHNLWLVEWINYLNTFLIKKLIFFIDRNTFKLDKSNFLRAN